ncbi:MAG: hypothetical protein AAFN50_15075 [Pseudomonadota bacterium]
MTTLNPQIRTFLALILCFGAFSAAGCSSSEDQEISRTLHVSPEKLAEIQREPWVKRFRNRGGPAARLGGLEDDSWPEGILFLEYGPYLHELGFAKRQMLIEIDGEGANDIFVDRWKRKRIKRPRSFHADHYEDLIIYLFDVDPGDERVLKMYLNVPTSASEVGSYEPEVEYWRIVFDR